MSFNSRQVRQVLSRLDRRVAKVCVVAVNATVDAAGRQIQVRVPRVSGTLAHTMQIQHCTNRVQPTASVTIGARDGSGDAAAVEFGTARTRPRPFFRVSIAHVKPTARADLTRKLRSVISS